MALRFKGIEYEYRAVNLIKDGGEQLKEEYLRLNPSALVPALHINGHTLGQSVAIMEYLDEVHPEKPLLPVGDAYKRALVRRIVDSIACDIQPIQNLRVLNHVGDEKKVAWAQHWIVTGFNGLEKLLKDTAGNFCVGDEITMADLCLAPQVYNARRFKVDLEPYPTILRVDKAFTETDLYRATEPSACPDCPPDLK
eukprot:Opistho-2@30422